MRKLLFIFLVTFAISGCTTTQQIENEKLLLKKTLTPLRSIIRKGVDLEFFISYEFPDRKPADYYEFFGEGPNVEIKYVKANKLSPPRCNARLAMRYGRDCEVGVKFLPNREATLSLNSYSDLGVINYNRINGSTYRSELEGVTGNTWFTYKEKFTELSEVSSQLLGKITEVALKLGYSPNQVKGFGVYLELDKEYSLEELKNSIIQFTDEKVISSDMRLWVKEQQLLKAEAENKKRLKWEAYERQNKAWQAEAKRELEAKNQKYANDKKLWAILVKDRREQWKTRYENKYEQGEKICTYDNRMGYIELISENNIKVLIKGKLNAGYKKGYFFGEQSFREYQQESFNFRKENEYVWLNKGEVSPCGFLL